MILVRIVQYIVKLLVLINYETLEDERFVALNSMTHDFVEWLYKYYRKDIGVITRLVQVLQKMKDYEVLSEP